MSRWRRGATQKRFQKRSRQLPEWQTRFAPEISPRSRVFIAAIAISSRSVPRTSSLFPSNRHAKTPAKTSTTIMGKNSGQKTKAGRPAALGAPLHFRSRSAHELLWKFLPANQQRLRLRIALDSLRSSINARENEVKQKNFRKMTDAKHFSHLASVRRVHSARVISFARGDVEARTPDTDFDRVIIFRTVRFLRAECKNVLVACLFGDLGIESRQAI